VLAGTRFVFTGALESMPRSEAERRVKTLGASVAPSVSGKTTHVVCGANPGSKAERAAELGIPLLDEEAFLALLGSHD